MYVKPSKTFRLSKTTKRILATITNDVARNDYKNQMIQAQIASETMVRREVKSNFGALPLVSN
jgi:N-methylhydantoinase B/oxoprolinase/acetone carboxylase alpha subunit